ncbi:DUF4062 domain-containing protein [Hymenobacter sp. BT559]|uniref:DUF4062 domain-containing protein n=1 Tax=Hymenobacter sp. BT559 TaxID=2795729 RepID=UPI0018EAC360|nr:DUF4062 domain-containing protein [Hymenobacter sp. BT559]MBJ6146380.1 DUF4062 domain-containing protein [Hymenobacter sp. BT559]
MAKKYQVFISSTFDDLKEHRDAVVKAVLQLGHLPVGMEMFNAGDQTQWETIKSYIDSSDYYLVILAHRYGSKDPASGLSYTEKEYDYAGEKGVPRLGFVIDKTATWPADKVEAKAKKKLDDFKRKVGSARVIKFWDTVDKLAYHVSLSLGNEITINPRVGWVRATEAASPQVAEELARLSKENMQLQIQLTKVGHDNPIRSLEALININAIRVSFDIEDELTLRDIFEMSCDLSPDTTAFGIANKVQLEYSLNDDQWYEFLDDANEALEELQRLGLVKNLDYVLKQKFSKEGNSMHQVKQWEITEKGTQLYALIKYTKRVNKEN